MNAEISAIDPQCQLANVKSFNLIVVKKESVSKVNFERRDFLKQAALIIAAGSSPLIITACNSQGVKENAGEDEDSEEEIGVSPPEDLMREHGLLNRMLLVYENLIDKLSAHDDFDPALLETVAGIIRHFIEDYHEKLEEDHLFPRFEKAGILTDLVSVLRKQHTAGRNVTEQIIGYGNMGLITTQDEKIKLAGLMTEFIRMYRPHEAREDTILFPSIRKIVSPSEFYALGEDFEKKEHDMFGEDGFMTMVDKVAQVEKKLGIYDLSMFTP